MSTEAPSHAVLCRALLAGARTATLATLARDPDGFPFASLVSVADDGGRPLMLLSTLAEHTQNLRQRPQASLLLCESAPGDARAPHAIDPLALGRATLIGRCRPVDEAEVAAARAIYLAAHPEAAAYVDFRDFALWRLEPEALRYVGGFGRMSWVDPAAYLA
jgi:putative heme iron utilization protein